MHISIMHMLSIILLIALASHCNAFLCVPSTHRCRHDRSIATTPKSTYLYAKSSKTTSRISDDSVILDNANKISTAAVKVKSTKAKVGDAQTKENVSSSSGKSKSIGRKTSSSATARIPDLTKKEKQLMVELLASMQADDENESSSNSNSDDESDLLNSVIRVYCTHVQPSFGMPWQRLKQDFSTSTGFIIGNNRILTNAHAVEYGSIIQVKKRQSENKYLATVVAVGHECDLALLEVNDPTFWDGLTALTFGDIPNLLEDVSVVGYPVGGDSISITSGVVSRIEMQEYAQASAELLAIQIDAAINPGNSGGPVVNNDGEVIGVAFQSLSDDDVENIGYVVPVNVISHFLLDVERNGFYSGVCSMGVRLQGMENSDLRKYYNMTADETGVVVLSIAPLAPASNLLHKGDVILSIDNVRIGNDGTIPFREGRGKFKERVHLSYLFTQRFASDSITIVALRQGKRIELQVPLWVSQPLIPRILLQRKRLNKAGDAPDSSINGGIPSYLVSGGLVFIALSREYLQAEFNVEHMHEIERWTEEYKLLAVLDETKTVDNQEVVLLSQVIAHTCNIGYEMYRNLRLKSFNSVNVTSLKHLKQLYDALDHETSLPIVYEFANGQIVVLNSQSAKRAEEQILAEHFIPSAYSNDLV